MPLPRKALSPISELTTMPGSSGQTHSRASYCCVSRNHEAEGFQHVPRDVRCWQTTLGLCRVAVDCPTLGTPNVKSPELRQLANVHVHRRTGSPGSGLSLKLGCPFLRLSSIWFWLQRKTLVLVKPESSGQAQLSRPLPSVKSRQLEVGGDSRPLGLHFRLALDSVKLCDFILPTQGPGSGYFPWFHGSFSIPEAPGSDRQLPMVSKNC